MDKKEFENILKKKFGSEAVSYNKDYQTKFYSTGIIELDIASGIGGFPRGRIIEIFGPESSGKSLTALKAIATAQKLYGLPSIYFDLEASTPPDWLQTLGIDLDLLTIVQANTDMSAQRVFEMMRAAIRQNIYAYCVLDSVVGMVPKEELDGSIEDNTVAIRARVMSRGVSVLVPELAKSDTTVIFINQIRDKVGVMFGNPETTPGGKALKFYAAQRYRVNKKSQSDKKENGAIVGHVVNVKCSKNKLAPPQRTAEFPVSYTHGVDDINNLVKTAIDYSVIVKDGQTYTFNYDNNGGSASARGKDAFISIVATDENLKKLIYEQTLQAFFDGKVATSNESTDDKDIDFDEND